MKLQKLSRYSLIYNCICSCFYCFIIIFEIAGIAAIVTIVRIEFCSCLYCFYCWLCCDGSNSNCSYSLIYNRFYCNKNPYCTKIKSMNKNPSYVLCIILCIFDAPCTMFDLVHSDASKWRFVGQLENRRVTYHADDVLYC